MHSPSTLLIDDIYFLGFGLWNTMKHKIQQYPSQLQRGFWHMSKTGTRSLLQDWNKVPLSALFNTHILEDITCDIFQHLSFKRRTEAHRVQNARRTHHRCDHARCTSTQKFLKVFHIPQSIFCINKLDKCIKKVIKINTTTKTASNLKICYCIKVVFLMHTLIVQA